MDVGYQMIEKFRLNTTNNSIFEDPVLNKNVSESNNMKNFLKRFGNILRDELHNNGGDINSISSINMGEVRPIFNGYYNRRRGLQILMNDTEFTEIELDSFRLDAFGNWEADVTVTVNDHFGLDKNDALTYQFKHPGFADWWLLQHTRGFVPFKTKAVIRKTIKGSL